jgi:hypothetical protein
MSAGALLIPVNPCYFARMRNIGDANRSAVHCNIWAGALVNNKGKYKRARHTLAPIIRQLTEFPRLFPVLRCMQASLRPGGTRRSRPARQPNGVPAIVDACRSLQIPRLRRPNRIYGECAATLLHLRGDFGPS